MNKELIQQLTEEDYQYLSNAMYRGVVFLRNKYDTIDNVDVKTRWGVVKQFIDNDLNGKDLFDTLCNIDEINQKEILSNKLKQAIDKQIGANFVDLGLPSGTKWAKYNIGANSEEEHGNYYTFDEAVELFKSRNDKMPSKENFEELINNTNLTVTEVNGVDGMRFTSKINGNSIFVPFSGGAYEGSVDFVGDNTYVWSSSVLDSGSAWSLYCDSDGYAGVGDDDRYYGDVLRPVCGSAVEICREMVKQNRTF